MSKDVDQLSRRLHQLSPRHHAGGLPEPRGTKGVPSNALTGVQAAYIAGLVDGEGTVTLTRRHRNENRQLCVTISSTERPMLEFVRDALGVGKITNKSTASSRHSPSFTYAIANRQALNLLRQLEPWLRSYKRERARLILRDYVRVTPRNGKYSPRLKSERTRFEAAVLEIRAHSASD